MSGIRSRIIVCMGLALLLVAGRARSDDPWQAIPRALPPAGIEIDPAEREALQSKLDELQQRLQVFGRPGARDSTRVDIEIYLKAVRFALDEYEFFREQDVKAAHEALRSADERLDQLKDTGRSGGWFDDRGLLVRGYRSEIDGSVQPYALEIPEDLDLSKPVPLYVWLHGRGDKLTDLAFISERGKKPGQLQPKGAIVLHPFGRSCLGWKSTAEVDVLEAIEAVCERYPIDRNRIVLAGFSMGGAGAWHIGAHYADRFAAVHAGAGFVDVRRYQNLTPEKMPPSYEQRMWDVYDVPKYVRNLFNLPVVAYSGEVDKQKDAADFMGEAFASEGGELIHLVGPGMGHKYHPDVLKEVMAKLDDAVRAGRNTKPESVSLQTRTLRYNRMHWLEILGLDAHWQDSRVDAKLVSPAGLEVTTKNIHSLKLTPPRAIDGITIDGQQLAAPKTESIELVKEDGKWAFTTAKALGKLNRKRPGQQGPIDDVLLEPFLVVTPSGKSSPEVDRWVTFELEHLRRRWKNVYRGTLREVLDVNLTPDERMHNHLICFGDAESNRVLREVASELPIPLQNGQWQLGDQSFAAGTHVPLLIAPNPLNPAKYLVINSGPTHREAHDRTNSLQNPKLGDWAIVDVRTAPSAESPGKILAAGVFDEEWKIPPQQ
jgi:pimeloyl-ACP methyl ester carboxylesterase